VRVSVTDTESTNGAGGHESKSDNMSRSSNNNVITLQDIMRDKYGNYVI
jgi:hypothetical protein